MVDYTNECCSCATPGYPCIGSSCSMLHVPHFICDGCGEEVKQGELFWYEGNQLCIECIKEELEEVYPE